MGGATSTKKWVGGITTAYMMGIAGSSTDANPEVWQGCSGIVDELG